MESHKTWLRLAGLISVLMLVVGCGLIGKLVGPTFVNHPRPDLALDFSAFEDVGCARRLPELGCLDCDPDSALASLGCEDICVPSSALAGLRPAYPIAQCVILERGRAGATAGYLRCSDEGRMLRCMRYVLLRDGVDEFIDSREKFRETYAPIESAEEALGYVVAVTDDHRHYGLEYDPNLVYYVDEIEDTHVETVSDGYWVNLFHNDEYGGGPYDTFSRAYHVSHQGEILEVKTQVIFRDPSPDDLYVE